MRAISYFGAVASVALGIFAIGVFGQPAMSRGQQVLSISYDECIQRGRGAFAAEGWVNVGVSGNAVNGFRGGSGAYIICNPADNKMAVNVIVASLSNDGAVPGNERQRLQARMNQAAPPPSACNGFNGTWDTNYGSMRISVVGRQATSTYDAGTISGTVSGGDLDGQWTNSRTDGRRGPLHFRLSADGKSFTGWWREANGTGGAVWNGTCR